MSEQQAANDNNLTQPAGEPVSSLRKCPICGKPTVASVRPFCSKRCADIDLHRWLGGNYAIPAADADEPPEGQD